MSSSTLVTPTKTRVLIVDDQHLMRRLLHQVIAGSGQAVVQAEAADGAQALARLGKGDIDLVVLDVEMPVKDGLSTLREIRSFAPELPVIMFSAVTKDSARHTVEALALGASDWVPKPSSKKRLGETIVQVRRELLPRISALVQKDAPATPIAPPRRPHSQPESLRAPVQAVVIASSTGGPAALESFFEVLKGTKEQKEQIVLVAQHMPVQFTGPLAQRISSACRVEAKEAEASERLRPGVVYIAPGGQNMQVVGTPSAPRARLSPRTVRTPYVPSADLLFESAAQLYGAGTVGIVLTGMGDDGRAGCEAISLAGGVIAAQDEGSSVVWGMPRQVAQAGLAQKTGTPGELARWLDRLTAPKLRTVAAP